jgi:Ca-activated chloride channel homolog
MSMQASSIAYSGAPPRTAFRLLLAKVVAIAALVAMTGDARPAAPRLVTPAEMRSGALLLDGGNDRYVEAPLVGTDVDIVVSGPTARARVTQIFHNPTDGWVEAVYVYPLPEGGAVDTLKMVIGERVIVGDVQERKSARVVYEQAKADGRKAGLIEQERPNIFTTSVANIGPGEKVVVQIEYQEPVRQSEHEFSLRLPLVVGPRYNPAPIVQTVELRADGAGWGRVVDPVPDRDRISPPVLDPRRHAPVNPLAITVRLQAGFPLGEVKSHHHAIAVEEVDAATRLIRLADGPVPADRDFELTWRPAAGDAPAVGLFRERVGDADYLLAFVTPPIIPVAEERRPRDIVLVVDNSGSMGGTSILQAKASLIFALGRLAPTDRFNLIRFDDTMDVLFPDVVPASSENVARARAFVAALEARGGTEMVPAMRAALTDHGSDSARVRQVVFLTDGAIGNEQQLFDTIAAMRGRSRVFMVGIGSAPNSYLMTRAAELGRGTFTHIGSVDQVAERMRALFGKLEAPVVTNMVASFGQTQADATPTAIPDLYRGEPVVLAAKVGALTGSLELKGMIGERPWTVTLPLAGAAEGRGLSKLWARRKIADAEVARTLRQITLEEGDRRILALALEHHLVTRLTSLVAVDRTPSRPDDAPLTRSDVPLNLPAGWDFDKVFGGERSPGGPPAERRAGSDRLREASLDAYAAVRRSPQPVSRSSSVALSQTAAVLPKTATDAELRAWLGLLLAMLGGALLLRRRVTLVP